MKKETQLLFEIEQYRTLVNETVKNKPLISEEMIDYSQKLDKLLNEYNHFVNKV
jgi:hypothetical protein